MNEIIQKLEMSHICNSDVNCSLTILILDHFSTAFIGVRILFPARTIATVSFLMEMVCG